MSGEHTPGPWVLRPMSYGYDLSVQSQISALPGSYGGWFVELHHGNKTGIRDQEDQGVADTFEADARLIAAAPDYDAAARAMVARHDEAAKASNFTKCGCIDCSEARVVIAKATTQSEVG